MRFLAVLLLASFVPALALAGPKEDVDTIYSEGHDYETSRKMVFDLATQGNPVAENMVGGFYKDAVFMKQSFNGIGGEQGFKEAMKWYRKAAESGNPDAQYNIGDMYDKGYGVAQDYTEAVKWYQKAAAQSQEFAESALGSLYENGRGVEQDYIQAYMWYSLANKQDAAFNGVIQISKKMTLQQISEAKKLADDWKPLPSQSSEVKSAKP